MNKKVLAMSCACVDIYPEKQKETAGGNALNLAANCAKVANTDVYIMGNIGNDHYGQLIMEMAKKHYVNYDHLHVVEGKSATHIIHISSDGERYFTESSWDGGVYENYRVGVEDAIFMQSMNLVATTINSPDFSGILDIRRKSDFLLAVDFHDEKLNNIWERYFDAIDLFFWSADKSQLHILCEWSKKYKTIFVGTLGKDGSVAYKNGIEFICEAEKVHQIVDTTGCGDSYQGAFIAEYIKNLDTSRAMKKGSEAAALTLSHVGALK